MQLVSIKKILYLYISLNINMYFSVMLLHCTCSKIYLCFLATLKNIAPGYFLPILAPFTSKTFPRMHCISSHGLENGSRQ